MKKLKINAQLNKSFDSKAECKLSRKRGSEIMCFRATFN